MVKNWRASESENGRPPSPHFADAPGEDPSFGVLNKTGNYTDVSVLTSFTVNQLRSISKSVLNLFIAHTSRCIHSHWRWETTVED